MSRHGWLVALASLVLCTACSPGGEAQSSRLRDDSGGQTALETRMDANSDGYITFLEFQEVFEGNAFAVQSESQLRSLFDGYDVNRDGRLDADELSGSASPVD
jgi:hypothetical protein